MGNFLFNRLKKGKMEAIPKVVPSIFELSAKDADGNMVQLSSFKEHKALLFVNVASK